MITKRYGGNTIFLLLLLLFPAAYYSKIVAAETIPVVNGRQVISADLNQPTALAIADDGRLYVLDGAQGRVVVFSPRGDVLFSFAADGDFDGELRLAMDIALAGDRVVVADSGNQRLMVFDTQGNFIDDFDTNTGGDEKLSQPVPVAVYIHENVIIWSDRANHRICRTELQSGRLLGCFGERGQGDNQFQFPYQISKDRDDYFYIVDVLNARVQVSNKKGRYFSDVSRFGVHAGELFRPNGAAIDGSDNLFVGDSYFGTISVFNAGRYLTQLHDQQGRLIQFKTPVGLELHENKLYVVDSGADNVTVLTLDFIDREHAGIENTGKQRIELSRKNCISCHLSWANTNLGKAESESPVLPVASMAMCYSCHHGVVIDSRLAIPHGEQHPTLYDPEQDKLTPEEMERREDELPKQFPLSTNSELLCTSCHTPHNSAEQQQTLYQEHNNAWLRVSSKDGDLCERCHESKIKAARELDPRKRGINHPLAIKFKQPPKKNTQGYVSEEELYQGLPEDLSAAAASLGLQSQLICQSCHQVHGGHTQNLLAITPERGELCGQCHFRQNSKDEKEARRKGVHPVNVKLEEPITRGGEKISKVTCESCHQVHSGSLGTALLPEPIKKSEQLCVDCHERQHAKDKDDALTKGIHPVNHKMDEAVDIAGNKVKKIGCLSCHAVHSGKPNTPALVANYKNGELCEHCHEGKRGVIGTDHDLRITAKKKQNHFEQTPAKSGVCGACHTMHRGEAKLPRQYAAVIVDQSAEATKERDAALFDKDRMCLNCHQKDGLGEEAIVDYFSHPSKDIVLRSDKTQMPLLAKDESVHEFGAIACVTCHEPHTWKPLKDNEIAKPADNDKNLDGNSKDSFLRVLGVKGTFCVDCHSIEALPKFKYFHDKALVRNIGVKYLE